MTTEARAKLYEAQHLVEHEHRGWAVYNPRDRPVGELPVIYGFNNGGSQEWYMGEILAEDGTHLGGHVCSAEGFMPHDLGVLEGARPDRHETFRKYYPGGYRMEFVPMAAVGSHAGLQEAYRLNQEMQEVSPWPTRRTP